MTLFDQLFYSASMRAVFSDENRLQRMLDVESALASAQVSVGLVPSDAAATIQQACRVENIDVDSLREDGAACGNLAIPLVKQLTAAVDRSSPEASRYVHWGATSQDILDTGLVLQMGEALRLIDSQLLRVSEVLAELVQQHAATTMVGRTWLQHAVPVSFGWKASTWLDCLSRHRQRLRETRDRCLVLQFSGAVGTLASLGENGSAVADKLAESLGLALADISWHSSRDRFAEIAAHLGMLAGSLGKMARDLALMMQTEVSEVCEGGEGRGGSSTMPHKRNPILCAAVLATTSRVPAMVATILTSMGQEHERGLGNWQAEWETLPDIFNLCGGALEKTNALIRGLHVDVDRMAANLEMTGGLIYAEAVSMALAAHVGKPVAHAMVERLCGVSVEGGKDFRNVMGEDPQIGRMFTATELDRLFDPSQYLGNSRDSIDLVLATASALGVATRSGWIERAGTRLHFKDSGSLHLPVVVLSNSLGSNMTMWDAQLAELGKFFRIVRYDARGHGQSTVVPGPCTIELLGQDVIALLDALGIVTCTFCGISMGGMVGQWLGENAAPRIKNLVLSNTAAKIGSTELWNARIASMESSGMHVIAPSVLERWFTPAFRRSHPGLMAETCAMMETTSVEGYVACCTALRDTDFRDTIKNIVVPTLVIAGTHDPATPVADGGYLASAIPGAQLVQLDASHLSNIEASEAFNEAVLQFLNRS